MRIIKETKDRIKTIALLAEYPEHAAALEQVRAASGELNDGAALATLKLLIKGEDLEEIVRALIGYT